MSSQPELQKNLKGKITDYLTERGIPFIALSQFKPVSQIGYGHRQVRRWFTDINSAAGYILAENKEETNDLLRRNGLPVPPGDAIENEDELEPLVKKLGFPLVIKPARGTFGAQAVTIDIKSLDEAKQAFRQAQPAGELAIVEKMVTGRDFRILVFKNKVIAGLERIPAHVVGDGQNTIKGLIEKENQVRAGLTFEQQTSCKPLLIDSVTESILKKQGLNYSSVPQKDQAVNLRFAANICTGGLAVGITKDIHPENARLCELVTRIIGLEVAGVDIMASRIDEPIRKTGGAIIEVNPRPGIMMHNYPSSGDPVNTVKIFIDGLCPNPEKMWIPIKIDGKVCRDPKIIAQHLDSMPKQVVQLLAKSEEETKTTDKPRYKLLTYLLDPLTTAVDL